MSEKCRWYNICPVKEEHSEKCGGEHNDMSYDTCVAFLLELHYDECLKDMPAGRRKELLNKIYGYQHEPVVKVPVYDGTNGEEILAYVQNECGRPYAKLRYVNKSKSLIMISDIGPEEDMYYPGAFFYFKKGDRIEDARLIRVSAQSD